MPTLAHLAAVVIAIAAAVVIFHPLLRLPSRPRLAALLIVALALAFVPLLIPADLGLARAIAAIFSFTIAFKFYDLHFSRLRNRPPPPWPRYLLYLFSPFCMVERLLDHDPIPRPRENLITAIRGLLVLLFTVPIALLADLDGLGRTSFLLEHAVKITLAFAILYGIAQLMAAAYFSLRLPGRAWMHFFFAARTPAEFWRLYNRPPGQFFCHDVYLPLGGRRHPVRATMIVFLINGLGHEYIAFCAIGAFQGWQVAFFLVQGAAVALTRRLNPRGPLAVIGIILTLAFGILTSLLFCASANQFLPWYSDAAPTWMPRQMP